MEPRRPPVDPPEPTGPARDAQRDHWDFRRPPGDLEGTPASQRIPLGTSREAQGHPEPRSSSSWFSQGLLSEPKVHCKEPPQCGWAECAERLIYIYIYILYMYIEIYIYIHIYLMCTNRNGHGLQDSPSRTPRLLRPIYTSSRADYKTPRPDYKTPRPNKESD